MSEKLITVIDASGDVGRHVVKALLESNFKVRALVCGLDDEIKQHAKVEGTVELVRLSSRSGF